MLGSGSGMKKRLGGSEVGIENWVYKNKLAGKTLYLLLDRLSKSFDAERSQSTVPSIPFKNDDFIRPGGVSCLTSPEGDLAPRNIFV